MSNYPQPPWQPSPPLWAPPLDTEHRLTTLEVVQEHHSEAHEEHYEITDQHRDRLNLHERILLVLVGGMSIIMQDKFPKVAALIKGLIQ